MSAAIRMDGMSAPSVWLPSMGTKPTVYVTMVPLSAPNPHEVDRGSRELMIEGMAATLERHGIEIEKGPLPYPTGGGPTPVTIAASATLAAFFAALGAEAGRDAWRRLKALIADLRSPPDEADVEVTHVMVQPGTRRIAIPPDLPDRAYEELIRIVAAGGCRGGILVGRRGATLEPAASGVRQRQSSGEEP